MSAELQGVDEPPRDAFVRRDGRRPADRRGGGEAGTAERRRAGEGARGARGRRVEAREGPPAGAAEAAAAEAPARRAARRAARREEDVEEGRPEGEGRGAEGARHGAILDDGARASVSGTCTLTPDFADPYAASG